MTVAEDRSRLKSSIYSRAVRDLVGELVIDRIPVLFRNDAGLYREWRQLLAAELEVDACDIYIVGSAGCGFSLSPKKEFRSFRAESDVDVAIISAHHFDLAWRTLRRTRRTEVPSSEWHGIRSHQTNYVYWGCIASDFILARLPYGTQWVEAAALAATWKPTVGREIKFRIYRDASSLRDYTMNGLENLKSKLIEENYAPEIP